MSEPQKPLKESKEPVLTRTAIVIISGAVVYGVGTFGFELNPEIVALVVAGAGPLILGLLARAAAWSPASVSELIDDLTKSMTEPPAGLGDTGELDPYATGDGSYPSPPVTNRTASYDAPTTNLRYPHNP